MTIHRENLFHLKNWHVSCIQLVCQDCVADAKQGGQDTLLTAQKLTKVSATLAQLPAEERTAIEAQKFCAVQTKSLLGSMGAPVKLELNGQPVYLCCAGCTKAAQADPTAIIAKVEQLKKSGMMESHDHDGGEHSDKDHEGHEMNQQ